MNIIKWLSTLILKLACLNLGLLVWAKTEWNYSPCIYVEEAHRVHCINKPASLVLDAFRRNKNNSDVEQLEMVFVTDMSDSILEEILSIVAVSADKVRYISLDTAKQLEGIPKVVRTFTNLENFQIFFNDGIKILPEGSMTFSSDNLRTVYCSSGNLEVIEPGAFQGNFNETLIFLSFNRLTKFDEAVFKSLLHQSTAFIDITGNPIACDCDLAWIIRDNRQLLSRSYGDCLDENGTRKYFYDVDPNSLANCSCIEGQTC